MVFNRRWRLTAIAAIVDGGLAGTGFGIIDAFVVRRSTGASLASSSLATLGLDIAFALVLLAPLFFVSRAILNAPRVVTLRQEIAASDAKRVDVVTSTVVVASCLALAWFISVVVGMRCIASFRNGLVAVALTVTVVLLLHLVVALVSFFLVPPIAARARNSRALLALAGSRRFRLIVSVGVTGALFGVVALIGAVWFSETSIAPVYQGCAAIIVTLAVFIWRGGRPPRRSMAIAVPVGSVALIAASIVTLTASPAAREDVDRFGIPSKLASRALYRMGDRDGDGVAGLFGGADCDDHDPQRSPLHSDVPGNGIDENCTGRDAAARPPASTDGDPPATRWNILLITVDTVRADHLGLYGYSRRTSPNLDRLAASATVFARAETASPSTRRALPCVLYGRNASSLRFEIVHRHPSLQDNSMPTLASALKSAGYRTHAIMAVSDIMQPAWLKGFDSAETVSSATAGTAENASSVTDAALMWLREPSALPRFTWVHYIDAHEPYSAPSDVFGGRLIDRYDGEIQRLDAELGRLLTGLGPDLLTHTIVVVTADHGEAFDEHGVSLHGRSLYEEETHIPLIVRVPDLAPRVIDAPVSTIDIAPTLLDAVGLPTTSMNGSSLFSAIKDGTPPTSGALIELFPDDLRARNAIAVLQGRHKLIWNIDDNRYKAFDLVADPGERDPKPVTPELLDAMHALRDSNLPAAPPASPAPPAPPQPTARLR